MSLSIPGIAERLNELAPPHPIGQLQNGKGNITD